MFFEFQWEVNNGLLRILLKGQIFAFDVYFTTQTSILRSRDTPVPSTVQSDRLSHSWCKDYAKLRNISFRSISSRFAPFRSANYSKPRVITIHEVWKGRGGAVMEHGPSWAWAFMSMGLHGPSWRRLSLICQMGGRLFTNIFLPLLNYAFIFVHWPVQCNISPRRVSHQSPTFRFFSWVELRTNKWPFHRSTTTGTVFQLIGLAYKRLNQRD